MLWENSKYGWLDSRQTFDFWHISLTWQTSNNKKIPTFVGNQAYTYKTLSFLT